MSVDKLVDSTQLDADLTSVANAIRTRGGTSASLAFPSGFVTAIQNIPSGGVTPTGTKQISISSNGTTTEDVTNYANAEITVSVPNSYSVGDEGKVVSNGALVSQSSATYTANNTYDTTLINSVTVNVSGGGGSSRLPDGFQEVEYIENPSTSAADDRAYIISGFTAKQSTRILAKVSDGAFLSRTSAGSNAFGAQYANFSNGNSNWRGEYATANLPGSSTAVSMADRSVPVILDCDKNRFKVTSDSGVYAEYSTTAKSFTTPAAMPFLGIYNNGAYSASRSRLYYAKIYDNGTLVRDFVPCKRISDGKVGLYDLCGSSCALTNSPFYISSNNNDPVAGGVVLGILTQ